MDGILPTPPVSAGQSQLQQFAQQMALDSQMLSTQLQIKLPATLMAQVLGNDKSGNLLIRANGSDLILSSPLALAKGAQVQIRLDSVSGNIMAELLSVDGKLPPSQPQKADNWPQQNPEHGPQMKLLQAMPQGAAKIAQPTISAPQMAPKVDVVTLSSPQTTIFKGIVLQPSPEIMQGVRATMAESTKSEDKLVKSLPEELKSGSGANLKITSVISQPKPQPNMQTNPQGEKIETGNSVLKGQEWMKAQLQDFAPTMKTAPSGNLQVNGLVLESQPDGEVTVETKLGLVRIEGRSNTPFPRGTEIMLEVTEFTKTPDAPRKETGLHELAREWPALKEILGGNKAESAKVAGSEHNFGGKLAGFVNAVKTGDAESWLGAEFLGSLDDVTRSNLLTKLNGDFANLRNLMQGDNGQLWQTVVFPIFDGQELHQARLHVKRFKDESAASEDGVGTRFIVELETSRYGEMQFDGLVRRLSPKRNFDLIIRNSGSLDAQTMQEIKDIFHTTQQISGFAGGIEFATGRQFPASPWQDLMNKKTPHDSVIS